MSQSRYEVMAWAAVSITEVVLLAYLTRKAAGEGVSVRRGQFNVKMSPPPLDEFTFARNSPQKSGIQPKKSLDSGTAPKVRMAPPGFNTSRRRSVSSESVSEQEFAWHPPSFPKDPETKARLEAILQNNILMLSLTPESKSTVIEAYERMEVGQGVEVVKEGDLGESCFIVESGRLSCDMKEKGHRCDYQPGQTFGELALMYGNLRAATITASAPCILWKLDRATFKKIVLSATQPRQHIFRDFIEQVEIFRELSQEEKEKLVTCSHHLAYNPGDIILEVGHRSAERYLYLLKSGSIAMIVNDIEVETLRSNHFFGERSILLDECPIADAKAKGACEVYRVPETVLLSFPKEFLERLKEAASSRFA